ncbi:MAG TPA: ABC transporter substrate-binding protein [Kofleriaceae bacterium]|nr:ABC transporter substrate-binding protein [Kofleriaceae bacterium]
MRLSAPALVLVPALALGLGACDEPDRGPKFRPAGATSPRAGGTLRVSTKDAIATLDPALANDDMSIMMLHTVADTLVAFGPGSTRLVPGLAERWELSPDGRTYRFWLREGLRYADGAPIVAADLEHALERPLSLADSPFAQLLAEVEGVADVIAKRRTDCPGIRATGERELEIRLATPNAAFLYILTMKFTAPLPRAYVAQAGGRVRTPLASGPYQVEEWTEGTRVVLVRNPHYRDPARQRPERIVMLENIPRDVQFLMFERGQLDAAERLAAPDLIWLLGRQDWAPYVQRMSQMNVYGSRMNVRAPPFDDRRMRQALNYGVNKDYMVKLLAGTAVPSHGILPPGMFGRDDALPPYPHDPAKARALLAEAGHGAGLTLEYAVHDDEEARKIATSMQADLAAVGVTMKITVMSFPTFYPLVTRDKGGAPFSYMGWFADYPDPRTFIENKFHSRQIDEAGGSLNDSFYANPELDRLLDLARVEQDPERRAALYHQAERILYDDAPWIWGYHQMITEVSQPYVQGYQLHPIWMRDFTTAWLDLGPDGEPVPR